MILHLEAVIALFCFSFILARIMTLHLHIFILRSFNLLFLLILRLCLRAPILAPIIIPLIAFNCVRLRLTT
jgi:hypothetical protein